MKKLFVFLGLILFVSISTYLYFLKKPDEKLVVSMDKDGLDEVVVDKAKEKKMGSWIEKPDTKSTTLKDVSGGEGSATAYILRMDGTLSHLVKAKLPKLEEGLAYEGWLVKKEPTLEFFSTGAMEYKDGVYVLEYIDKESDQIGFDEVVITLETIVDETPEEHILEGIIK